MKVRYIGTSGVSMPTLGIDASPGQVLEVPDDTVRSLGDDFELLEEVPEASGDGFTVSTFEVRKPDVVEVAKAQSGSVHFADGTELIWSEDGQTIKVPREYAEQLRASYPEGFGFDGDAAPEAPVAEVPVEAPVGAPVAEPTAAEKRAAKKAADDEAAAAAAGSDASAPQA